MFWVNSLLCLGTFTILYGTAERLFSWNSYVVELLSHLQLFMTLWSVVCKLFCPPLLPRAWSNSCPLSQWCYLIISSSAAPFSFCLQSSQHLDLFQWIGSYHQVPKLLSFNLSICPSNEYAGLISFRNDWFDLLVVQETLKSFLQHQIWKHRFFSAQPSLWHSLQPYMTTEKP